MCGQGRGLKFYLVTFSSFLRSQLKQHFPQGGPLFLHSPYDVISEMIQLSMCCLLSVSSSRIHAPIGRDFINNNVTWHTVGFQEMFVNKHMHEVSFLL